jgi:CubicO group peptidase (beta-lactamase class C family)
MSFLGSVASLALSTAVVGCGPSITQPRFTPGPDLRYTPTDHPARAINPNRPRAVWAAMNAMDPWLQSELQRLGYPGAAIGVVVDGQLAWAKGYGVASLDKKQPVTPDTVFRIGSITKTFTGLALLELRDEGKLALDDLVSRFVPEANAILYPTRDSGPIRIRHLMTHSAGFDRSGPLPNILKGDRDASDGELIDGLKDLKLEKAPGEVDSYSNFGAALAGIVISRASGMRYRDYVSQNILQPLGMTSSGWDPDPFGDRLATGYYKGKGKPLEAGSRQRLAAAEAMGGIYSNITDMAKYVALQLSAWPPRDDPEQPPFHRATLREGQLNVGFTMPGMESKGAFWILYDHCRLGHLIFHNGAVSDGYKATLFAEPRRGLGIIALGNLFDEADLNALDDVMREALLRLSNGETKEVPGLREAADKLIEAINAPDSPAFEAAFTPGFMKGVTTARDLLKSMGKQGGICGTYQVLPTAPDGTGAIELDCTKHTFHIRIAPQNQRIAGMWVSSMARCEP